MGWNEPLLGRQPELARLSQACAQVLDGSGLAALLEGEPGIGKTRIARELCSALDKQGWRAVWGQAWEQMHAPPLWPWISVLRDLQKDGLALPPALASLAQGLADAGPARPWEEAELGGFALLDGVRSVLARCAEQKPLLVVLDDAHFADVLSLRLARFLARSLQGSRTLLLLTCRPPAFHPVPEVTDLLESIGREGLLLELGPLRPEWVQSWAESLLGRPPSPLEQRWLSHAEGNPLFIDEMLRLFRRLPGGLTEKEPIPVPRSVQMLVRERVAELPEPSRRHVRLAAACGRDFRASTLAAVQNTLSARVIDELGPALRTGLIREVQPGRFRFSHALVLEAIERGLEPQERLQAHAQLFQVLQREGFAPAEQVLAEVCWHALHAVPEVSIAEALSVAKKAFRHAMSRLAFDRAVQIAEDVLEALTRAEGSPPAAQCDALLMLGEARLHAGQRPPAKQACLQASEVARAISDPERLAEAALTLGSEFIPALVDPDLVALLREALSKLSAPSSLHARLQARLAAALQPAADPSLPMALAREAIVEARALHEPQTLLATLQASLSALADYASPAERAPLNEEMLTLATQLGQRGMALRGHARRLLDAFELGDSQGAHHWAHRLMQLALEVGHPRWLARAAWGQSMLALMEGRFADSDTFQQQAEAQVARIEGGIEPITLYLHRFSKARVQHRFDAARKTAPLLAEATRGVEGTEVVQYLIAALIAFSEGLPDEGMKAYQGLCHTAPVLVHDLQVASWYAEVCDAAQDKEHAALLFQALRPHEDRIATFGMLGMIVEGPMTRALAMTQRAMGELTQALSYFNQARKRTQELGAVPLALRLSYDIAITQIQMGKDCSKELRQIAEKAEQLEMPGLTQMALRALSEKPKAPPAAHEPSLRLMFSLIEEGETWRIERPGKPPQRLKDSRGLRLLHQLLSAPDKEIHVLDLLSPQGAIDIGDAGEVLDAKARQAYKTRAKELSEELDEAEESHDLARIAAIREELEALTEALLAGTNLRGEGRRASSAAERARVNTQRRIRDAIRRIGGLDPELGRYLESTIRTGVLCLYRPV